MSIKTAARKRKKHLDLADTFGVRGAGSSWQAVFGMPLNEADLLFAVRREPVANRIVFQVAHDVWDNWFHVEKTGEMKETLALLSSEKYDLWTNALDKTVLILPKKEELKTLLGKESHFQNLQETLKEWSVAFDQLPPDTNPEGMLTFSHPKYDKFDFSVFANPDRIESIFVLSQKATDFMKAANGICKKYRIPLKFPQINEMIKSYDELLHVLKTPSEPSGDPALISRRNGKTLVSIPLDVVLAKVEYLRGIESTPLVHRPGELDEKKFKEEIARIQNEIGSYRAELREAKDDLSEAKKLLKTIKQLRDTLDSEMQLVKDSEKKSKRDLDKLTEEWKNTYHHLCEVFKLGYEEIDLSCSDAVESSGKKVSEKYAKGQEILESGLAQQLKNYPEFISKYKGQKPIDIVKKVTKEFEERIKKMTKLQEEYRRINEWILTNGSHIVTLENRNVTRNIMNVASAISLEILLRVHQKSNVKRIVEELADKIEVNVKDVYSKLFPDDASLSFEHLEEGQFLSMINNEPVTHPSGSQRVAISMGIMLSLGETFGLPILLDEAFDRVDANRLKFFAEYITGIASSARMPQICLAGFTTFNIEKNPDVLNFVNSWKLYLLKRATALEKNIQSLEEIPNS